MKDNRAVSKTRRTVLSTGLAYSLLLPAACTSTGLTTDPTPERASRIRHYVLATDDMKKVSAELYDFFQLTPTPERDGPGPTEAFGFYSHMMRIGETMLEIVQPIAPGHLLSKWLEEHGGDGGFMVVMQTFSAENLRQRAAAERLTLTRDMPFQGQTMIQFDYKHFGTHFELYEYTPEDGWWGNPASEKYSDPALVSEISGCDVAVDDPNAISAQAARLFLGQREGNTVQFEQKHVNFVPAGNGANGLVALDVIARDRKDTGNTARICGVDFRLV